MPNIAAESGNFGDSDAVLDIAVGIIRDAQGRILIAQRRPGTLGAGFWEFPGGKHEAGEAMHTTLARELQEELGITPLQPQHLIRMRNPAAMRPVRLHVWLVTQWQGQAHGREGQRVEWCPQNELMNYELLPGNRPLLNALTLPRQLRIGADIGDGTGRATHMLCLQAPRLADADYAELVRQVLAQGEAAAPPLLLDRSAAMVAELGAAGLYWPACRVAQIRQRPLGPDYLFGVAASDAHEMQAACRAEADFAVLSLPQLPFGWSAWRQLRADFGLPVYAAGVDTTDLDTAREHNAHGIAIDRAGPDADL